MTRATHLADADAMTPRLVSAPTAPPRTARVPRRRMLLRLGAIAAIAGGRALRTLPAALAVLVVRGRPPARRRIYRGLVEGLQALGPAFVKFGQIASARADALPAELCAEMSRLHDAVAPMSRAQAEEALRRARAATPALRAVSVDLEPIGSGSIACVYKGVLPDGALVALKLKRPDIDARMQCDLAIVQAMARAGQGLPKLRGMPIADLLEYISRALLGQLDLAREQRHIAAIRDALSGMPGIRVPAVHPTLCGPECLVFEYLPGLDASTAGMLAPSVRGRLGERILAAVHKLFFEDGLVHCDLHPGNLYVTRDQEVVILDAGYCVRLPDRVRRLIGEFFARMAIGDGVRCGEIVLESAVDPGAATDAAGFVSDFADLVARHAGPGNDFDMSPFGDAVYELQQRYGIYAASDFAFPLMSLMVVEGTLRRLWPDVDFQAVGAPAARAAVGE